MATTTKNYLDLTGLKAYDALIKTYIDTGDAKAIKTVLWDSTAEEIKFYKKENATLSDTADYSVKISSSDVANLKTRVGLDTQLNSYNTATDLTNIMNVLTGNSETTGSVAKAQADAINTVVGASTDAKTADTVNGAKAYADDAVATAVNGLDVDEFALATESNGVVTIKGIKEVDGEIAVGTDPTKNVVFAKAATTGNAGDISYDNTTSGLTATDAKAAIDELAAASTSGVASKTIWLNPNEGITTGYLKTYGIYQGANSFDATTNPATLIGKIDIPKDLVVTAGSVGTVTVADEPYEGAVVGDKYIDLTIANQTEHIYIPANSLVDIYTPQASATQVQLAIDNNNVISATIVAGSITATELASDAVTTTKIADSNVTTAKIADDAVTADKVAISAHSESQTAGTDGLAITVTTTDGQVSAVSGSIAANTYDAYGAATAAVAALDTPSDVNVATYNSTTTAITITGALSETDGIISGVSTNDIVIAPIGTTDINAIFNPTTPATTD